MRIKIKVVEWGMYSCYSIGRGVQTMVDIRKRPDILDLVNAILNNQGIVEIKNEVRRDGTDNLVVVEIKRQVRTKKPETR